MARISAGPPPVLRTTLSVDAMYYHAALQAHENALRCDKKIRRAERAIQRAQGRAERILERHDGDSYAAAGDLEPIYINMESLDYDLGAAHAPQVQAFAMVHILCAASLESHITDAGRSSLPKRPYELFERFSLEAKWMTLPKLLGFPGFDAGREPFQGFAKMVRLRNASHSLQSSHRAVGAVNNTVFPEGPWSYQFRR